MKFKTDINKNELSTCYTFQQIRVYGHILCIYLINNRAAINDETPDVLRLSCFLHPVKSLAVGTFNCIMIHLWSTEKPLLIRKKALSQSKDKNCSWTQLEFWAFNYHILDLNSIISGFEFDFFAFELNCHFSCQFV